MQCPCDSGALFDICCGPFVTGAQLPKTPEQLMRSRYTAYSKAMIDYIAATMLPPASERFDHASAREWALQVEWLGLKVKKASSAGARGYVEFIASFKDEGKEQILHELSEFHFIDGKWYYVDGKFIK